MSHFIAFAFLIGVVAGLRSLTAPAVVSWAVRLGWLHPDSSMLSFLGHAATLCTFSVLAIVELITDQLPKTPSRKAPPGFIARIVTGTLCGTVFGSAGGALPAGAIAGLAGAVAGTLGGYEARVRLARALGKDLPAALIEDAIAIGGAFLLVRIAG
jgi:uncharacterized membrane protein